MMTANEKRLGNFTSSEIVALMANGKTKGSLGKPAYTYIEDCNYERRLGRSIDSESNARPLTWGKMCEPFVFGSNNLVGIEYKIVNEETIVHPTIDYWAGSPDAVKFDDGKTVVDLKCPITLKSFCQLVAPLYQEIPLSGMDAMNWIRAEHKDGEKYFIQLVSNAILTGAKYAELIIYCPYKSELDAIRESVMPSLNVPKAWNWVYYAEDNELPWIPDGGFYKNINKIRFEVPQEDKIALHERVIEAGKLLIPRKQLIAA